MNTVQTAVETSLTALIKQESIYNKALANTEQSKEKLSDCFMSFIGVNPNFKEYQEKQAVWSEKVLADEPNIKPDTLRKRWSDMVKLAKHYHDFVIPKSDNPDAVKKAESRAKYSDLTDSELEMALDKAEQDKDYKTCLKLIAEQEKRAKMLERAKGQGEKVFIKDLIAKVKDLDLETARLVNWVIATPSNIAKVKSLATAK